jgi:ribose transport system permease protein
MSAASAETASLSPWQKATLWFFKYAFLFAFVAMIIFFSLQSEAFLGASNVMNIARGSVVVLLIALALTMVISSGGIDLSVGVALDFGAWFVIIGMASWGLPWPLAVVAGLVGGSLIGALNALLVVVLGVTPFLATLGTFFIGRSIQQIGTGGGANVNYRQAPEGFQAIAQGATLEIPNILLVGAIVLVVFFIVMELSTHGRRIHAMGLQNSAARVAGIDTRKYRAWVFILSGTTAAIGGILLSSGLRIYTPMAGFAYLLDGIAAVFIGASLHRGGRPNVIGTVIGVLFLSTLGTGLDIIGIDFNLKAALKGIILVLAITIAVLVSNRLPQVERWFAQQKKPLLQ